MANRSIYLEDELADEIDKRLGESEESFSQFARRALRRELAREQQVAETVQEHEQRLAELEERVEDLEEPRSLRARLRRSLGQYADAE